MDPGTALAVASLALQLAGTVQTINEFLRTIRDAPSELVNLIETMDLVQSNLNHVHYLIEQQLSDSSLAGSLVFILNALRICEKRVGVQKAWVEKIKQSLTTRHLMKRTWASLNIRPKKIQLSEMQGQLREALANLHFAVTNNQWHVQLQQVQITTTLRQLQMRTNDNECKPVSTNEDGLLVTPRSRFQYTQQTEECALAPATSSSALRITSKEQNIIWYRGVFGFVATQEKWISTSKSGSRTVGKPISAEKVLRMASPFLGRAVELYFGASFASVPRALRVYQVIEWDAPIMDMCMDGDLEGIQNEFAKGTISPFVVDKYGWTLLHWAVKYRQTEICSLLLRLGLDPDRADEWGMKALIYIRTSPGADNRDIDVMRTLTQAQKEITSIDVSQFMQYQYDDPEKVEYMLLLDPVRHSLIFTEPGENLFPALGAALRNYGRHITSDSVYKLKAKWESVIRRLLQIGVDLHAPVPREYRFRPDSHPSTLSPYGTPLEELFTDTTAAGEAKDAANAWLHILSTEGIDTLTYLEKEKALHATQSMFFCAHHTVGYQPRQLIFNLEEAPAVHADWWIDPECSIFLVRQEFKDMNILCNYYSHLSYGWPSYADHTWKVVWPISYPRWSDSFEPYSLHRVNHATWERLSQRAQERADRRWQKKARKAARLNGTQPHSSMPGAWPEQ